LGGTDRAMSLSDLPPGVETAAVGVAGSVKWTYILRSRRIG
jgi:hypothetical protein